MNTVTSKTACKVLGLAASAALTACGSGHDDHRPINSKPSYLGAISSIGYDGGSDDLLTAGLGKTGLASVAAPAYADPDHPTPAELRRNAIWTNYRAVVDVPANSGYGTLYGPNVSTAGVPTTSEGKIAGTEYLAYTDDGGGKENVTLMVQVPAGFDPANPCIVTGASSGSRGIYGAIGTSGEWGLKHNCAVAYADKGSGTGLYTFEDDSVNLQTGVRAARTAAGSGAIFAPTLDDAARAAFAAAHPYRVAFKHAHSQRNPEKDWGRYTLQAVEFAFYVLNEQFGPVAWDGKHRVRLTPKNTITIGASISNGAGSALLAAEQDTQGLITGVVASEPQIQPHTTLGYSVRQGGLPVSAYGKPLYDYASYVILYQPCVAGSAGRCTALVSKGLLSGATLAAQQADALARLHAYGWLPDSDPLQAAHALSHVLVAVTYANAYGRFSVTDKVCGFSFAQSDAAGVPVAMNTAFKAASFATQNGILGTPVYEDAVGGAKAYNLAVSPSTGLADQALDGFLCLRALALGIDPVTGGALNATLALQSARVKAGIAEVAATGNLHGKPTIIVQGRADTLVPVNHASRAYLGLNSAAEGGASRLRYIEVTNANHFETLVNIFPTVVVPLHVYLNRALDALYAHLRDQAGTPLPPSQVVRTVTRSDNAVPITVANVPPLAAAPSLADSITVTGTLVHVPN